MKHLATNCFALGSIFASFCILTNVASAVARDPGFFGDLKSGPFDVGYRTHFTYDASRPSVVGNKNVAGREMQISVWYPASAKRGHARIRFEDYVYLLSRETDFEPLTIQAKQIAIDRFFGELLAGGAKREAVANLRKIETSAMLDAPSAKGKFPLVVFAHASPAKQSIMSEYLASFGFIVAAVPSKGATTPAYRLNMSNLETMAEDIKFVEKETRKIVSNIDDKFGLIGMSNGAMAAMGFHLSNSNVGAIVSLDGSIGDRSVIPALKRFKAWKDTEEITSPVLHLYTVDNPYLDLSLLESLKADRFAISVKGMRHADFLNYGMFEKLMRNDGGRSDNSTTIGFEWVCRYTLNFLMTYLKKDAKSEGFLNRSPELNGAPYGLLNVAVKFKLSAKK